MPEKINVFPDDRRLLRRLEFTINHQRIGEIDEIMREIEFRLQPTELILSMKISPLLLAIYKKEKKIIVRLLTFDCIRKTINNLSQDPIGRAETSLHTAIGTGDIEIVKILLNCHEIDINKVDFFGHSPLWKAVRNRQIHLVKLLVCDSRFRLSVEYDVTSPLVLAANCHHGRKEILIYLIKIGFQFGEREKYLSMIKCENVREEIANIVDKYGVGHGTVFDLKILAARCLRDYLVRKHRRPLFDSFIKRIFTNLPATIRRQLAPDVD